VGVGSLLGAGSTLACPCESRNSRHEALRSPSAGSTHAGAARAPHAVAGGSSQTSFAATGADSILRDLSPRREAKSKWDECQDVVLGKLTNRSFPAKVELVRVDDGRVVVRKTFCPGSERNLDRELKARTLIDDPRLSPILATSGMSIYMPWHNDYRSFSHGLFKFYPLRAAQNVIDFLESLNARGLAMLDINPGSFLYDVEGNLKVVDCEYVTPVPAAKTFAQSTDFVGVRTVDGLDAPRSTGWNHFWRDAVGAPYRVVRFGSPRALASWRAVHVLLRIASLPIALLSNVRQTVLSVAFYWSRKRPWGFRILGRFSKTGSSSSPIGRAQRLLRDSRQTKPEMFSF
jgi:hypothetical protein